MHGVKVPFTSNIIQKCMSFILKYSIVGVGISVVIFKYLFPLLFIGTTTPRKILCQGIEPSVYEVSNDTNINERIYCRIFW